MTPEPATATTVDRSKLSTVNLRDCPECGSTHLGLAAVRLDKPERGYTHFAVCPFMRGRILCRVEIMNPETAIPRNVKERRKFAKRVQQEKSRLKR